MLSTALVLFLLAGFGSSQTVNDCPAGLARDAFLQVRGNLCYKFVLNTGMDWEDAKKDCAADGGILVVVNSKDISDWLCGEILNTYSYTSYYNVWIGLSDKVTDNDYVWEDGSIVRYENWAGGEGPSNTIQRLEDCVAIDPFDGLWHDYFCTNSLATLINDVNLRYVCQYPISSSK